jgi:hypothetical protein
MEYTRHVAYVSSMTKRSISTAFVETSHASRHVALPSGKLAGAEHSHRRAMPEQDVDDPLMGAILDDIDTRLCAINATLDRISAA